MNFVHPAGEYAFTSPVTLQIAGGNSSSATISSNGFGFASASAEVALPEPASAALLGFGLAGIAGLTARRHAPGQHGGAATDGQACLQINITCPPPAHS